jgi:hypothetical protein
MKYTLKTVLLLVFVGTSCYGQSLKIQELTLPLEPLKSNRQDVERIATVRERNPMYVEFETKDHLRLDVTFALELCSWHGWNVGPDVVVSFSVYPRSTITKKELDMDLSRMVRTTDDTLNEYYTDFDKGVQYTLTSRGELSKVTYTPSRSDLGLRCRGFGDYNSVAGTYSIFESFQPENLSGWDIGRLGGFLSHVKKQVEVEGTVLIYEQRGTRSIFPALKGKIEKYAFEIMGIPKDRIFIQYGGFRDKAEVETYLTPIGYPRPNARPQYARR